MIAVVMGIAVGSLLILQIYTAVHPEVCILIGVTALFFAGACFGWNVFSSDSASGKKSLMPLFARTQRNQAFSLTELLIIIAIIGILASISFPVFRNVLLRAKKVQAKNDLTEIVTAVNAYYTEYGKYPINSSNVAADFLYNWSSPTNDELCDVLRYNTNATGNNLALVNSLNPRGIVFLSPPNVKNGANPQSGIATQQASVNGVTIKVGEFVDPWGGPYFVAIDGDYSGLVQVGTALNYSDLTYVKDSPSANLAVRAGVIAASYGSDGTKGTKSPASTKFQNSDDIISWQ